MNQRLLDMTDPCVEIDSLGLSSQLPSPSTALLILLLTFHRRKIDTGTPQTQAMSARKLHQCWNVLHQQCETSELASRMISLVNEDGCTVAWERLSSAFLFR